MSEQPAEFHGLDAAGRATGQIAARPARLALLAVAVAVALSWALIAVVAIGSARLAVPGAGAPGDDLLRQIPEIPVPETLRRFAALCLGPSTALPSLPLQFAAATAMGFLMAVAMMLPSAAPMLKTYCEIAATAAAKGERAVHPIVLVAGYLSVWLCAAALFAALGVLWRGAGFDADTTRWLAIGALGIAGLYQFTSLKHACLTKCRMPFPILFARWSTRPAAIFRLGLDEGIWCFGCCWSLMLVMGVVGIMNLFWMALLAVFAIVEKSVPGKAASRIAGTILLVWAGALLLSAP